MVVNLYPFEATIAKPDVTLEEAIENIDIGGPSMIRSAAKNYESVTVVVDPADYDAVLENMRDNNGETTLKLRERLAIKAFIRTAEYDRAIGNFLNREQDNRRVVFTFASAGDAVALRRKSTSNRRALRRFRQAFRKTSWQGTFL